MNNDGNSSINIIKVLKGSGISIIITLIILVIFSALLTYTSINESVMPTVIITSTALSILVGSQLTTSQIRKNGIVNGALVGIIYVMLLYLVSSLVTGSFELQSKSAIMIVISIIMGGIGGIIGVNRK